MTAGMSHVWPWLLPWLLLACCPAILPAQSARPQPPAELPFRPEANVLLNAPAGLGAFFRQLRRLETGERQRIHVVHIGDSHLQAGWFSGSLRKDLHQRFGAAGRGLVFPYRAARTNGPPDLRSSTNLSWQVARNVQNTPALPTGISGLGMRTARPDYVLQLSVLDNPEGIDYRFDRVTFFTEKGPRNYDLQLSTARPVAATPSPATQNVASRYHLVQSGETLSGIAQKYRLSVRQLMELNGLRHSRIYAGQKLQVGAAAPPTPSLSLPRDGSGPRLPLSSHAIDPYLASADLDGLYGSLFVQPLPDDGVPAQTTLYGLMLEQRNRPGLLYHMIGVNGATYADFANNEVFLRQLAALQPDLIIVSMGTNESVNAAFSPERFYHQVDGMLHQLEQFAPHADLLLTTPPDGFRARRYPNPRVGQASLVLRDYAMANDLACWDFFDLMGGQGAIDRWYQRRLAQHDRLHLTQSGYELQGHLLFQALMQAYGSFLSDGSR
jgi:LysM repeat protein/lysophospholipase L1-like esterase